MGWGAACGSLHCYWFRFFFHVVSYHTPVKKPKKQVDVFVFFLVHFKVGSWQKISILVQDCFLFSPSETIRFFSPSHHWLGKVTSHVFCYVGR